MDQTDTVYLRELHLEDFPGRRLINEYHDILVKEFGTNELMRLLPASGWHYTQKGYYYYPGQINSPFEIMGLFPTKRPGRQNSPPLLTEITDENLKELAKLTQLSRLYLKNCTQITDEGIMELAKLKKLTELHLLRTEDPSDFTYESWTRKRPRLNVTRVGVAQLQKALPKCKIIHDPVMKAAIWGGKATENKIRAQANKPEGKLTKTDRGKVKVLNLRGHHFLGDLTPLSNLTNLEFLDIRRIHLFGSSLPSFPPMSLVASAKPTVKVQNVIFKANIDKLQKALPDCFIRHDYLTEAVKIEAEIRSSLKKYKGELTKADLEKVTDLNLDDNQLTGVKGLEKLTQLRDLRLRGNQLIDVKGLEKLDQLQFLYLGHNPDLTKAQIDGLQKALPKCSIISNFTK